MPETEFNNRSDRRVAQRLEAKRRSKQEKELIKSSPNASKYNAKKSRKQASQKARILVTKPITPPAVTLPASNLSEDIKRELIIYQEPVIQVNIPIAKEEDLALKELTASEFKEEQAQQIEFAVEELSDLNEEAARKTEPSVETLVNTTAKEELVDEVPSNTKDKKEVVIAKEEEMVTQEIETEKHAGIENFNTKQAVTSPDQTVTLHKEKTPASVAIKNNFLKAIHDGSQNKTKQELVPTEPVLMKVEDITVSPIKKKNIVTRLYKKSMKACNQFINEPIQLIGKVNRIGIISNETPKKPKASWKKLLKKND